jgi:hypothetical protein
MPDETTPTTFADAIEWIGSRSGHYMMRSDGDRIVISVQVGGRSASETARSGDESDLEAALILALGRISGSA